MIKICDTHLLIAKREHWEENSTVRIIPKKYAVCWALMEQGRTSDEVIQSMADLFKKPFGEVAEKFSSVFQNLANDGYLIKDEGTDI